MISKFQKIAIIFIILIFFIKINAQEKPAKPFFNRKNISIISISGVLGFTLVDSYIAWWKDDFKPFNFYKQPAGKDWFNEPGILGIDKVGHFYTSYFFYKESKNILLWGGHSESFAKWFSFGASSGIALLIELGDGFSNFGFDYQDLIFNLGGLTYGFLQDQIPFLNNFNIKWSFIPTKGFRFPPRFTEDYDAHIYWLTINMHNLIGNKLGFEWPELIQPAVGFSVANNGSRREFVFGIDFNFASLFSPSNNNSKLIKNTIDLFHFPAPGIKYSKYHKPEYRLFLFN